MADINSIIDVSRPINDIILDLKKKSIDIPEWSILEKIYYPKMHEIVDDKKTRKDKVRQDGVKEEAARIYIGLEKLLTRRITEFMFSIPVKRKYSDIDSDTRKDISTAIEKIYKNARINTENSKRGISYFAACEFFTIWYTVEKPNTLYGFKSKYKLKCKTYSPMKGDKLYPLFDEYDDMIAMSIEYEKTVGDEKVIFFETYTDEKHYKWEQSGSEWKLVNDAETISIGKIPGVYGCRLDGPIYDEVSIFRKNIEYKISGNSDVLDYNIAPVLKIIGDQVKGEEEKNESKRIFRVKNGGDIGYVSWEQSIESLKFHIDTLLKLFWSQAQMPDISFEKMAGMGNIGYDARQTILTDAHLKVGDESGAWIEVFDRECNIIKAFLKKMNTTWESEIDNVDVEHVITPFIQNDKKSQIEMHSTACGGKPIESQLDAIKNAGLSSNPEATLEQIREDEEAAANRRTNLFQEPSI